MALPRTLIDPKLIYLEPAVRKYPCGRDVLARFPDAELVEVASHWKIPQLADPSLAEDWLRVKRDTLVLGVKKGMQMRPNGRSADFIAPSSSNGCAMACAYCYVGRRKGYANPISVFVNIVDVTRALARHATNFGPKTEPNTIDPVDWIYDLGENGDLSVDASLSDNVRDLVAAFRTIPGAKDSFATKYVNRDLLDYDPQGRTRIRFSLMPETIAKIADVRTFPMSERILASCGSPDLPLPSCWRSIDLRQGSFFKSAVILLGGCDTRPMMFPISSDGGVTADLPAGVLPPHSKERFGEA